VALKTPKTNPPKNKEKNTPACLYFIYFFFLFFLMPFRLYSNSESGTTEEKKFHCRFELQMFSSL